jgi:hypothetical protein
MEHSNFLDFHLCPTTFIFTIKGNDLNLISEIFFEIGLQDAERCFAPRNSQMKPFLHNFPDGKKGMSRTKNLSGVGTLTIHCTCLKTYLDIILILRKEFFVTNTPGQKYSGKIEGMRDRGPLASALVCTYEWPVYNGIPESTSSVDSIALSNLEI